MYIGMLVAIVEPYEHIGKEWNRNQKKRKLIKNKVMWSQDEEWNKSSKNIGSVFAWIDVFTIQNTENILRVSTTENVNIRFP